MQHLLRDNYETPFFAPELEGSEFQLQQLEMILKLSVDDFKSHAQTLSSPDELSVYIARQLMRQVAPSLLWITMHDIDIAHAGAYSLYIEGIRRTDRLCSDLWKTIQSEPEYAGKTTIFILPDFGRDSDNDAGGNGFQHHRNWRCAFPNYVAAGGRSGNSRGCRFRPRDGIYGFGPYAWGDAWIFSLVLSGQADRRVAVNTMLPGDLKSEQFAGYPPEARKLVTNYLGTLRQLPLSFLPGLLRELVDYDFKFPAERAAREKELASLASLSTGQLKEWFLEFAEIQLSPAALRSAFDCCAKAPAQFVERLSAHLWSTHQLDAFRKASNDYADHLRKAVPPLEAPPIPRAGDYRHRPGSRFSL